jgi:DNA polymerase alpha subunit A
MEVYLLDIVEDIYTSNPVLIGKTFHSDEWKSCKISIKSCAYTVTIVFDNSEGNFLFFFSCCDNEIHFECIDMVENLNGIFSYLDRKYPSEEFAIEQTEKWFIQDPINRITKRCSCLLFTNGLGYKNHCILVDNLRADFADLVVIGKGGSYYENILLKKGIKGPCWLKITPETCDTDSWSNLHLTISSEDDISVIECQKQSPPLVMLYIKLVYTKENNHKLRRIFSMHLRSIICNSADEKVRPKSSDICVVNGEELGDLCIPSPNSLGSIYSIVNNNEMCSRFFSLFSSLDPDLVIGYDIHSQLSFLLERMGKKIDDTRGLVYSQCLTRNSVLTGSKQKVDIHGSYGRMYIDLNTLFKTISFSSDTSLTQIAKNEYNELFDPIQIIQSSEIKTVEGLKRKMMGALKEINLYQRITEKLQYIPITIKIANRCGALWNSILNQRTSFRSEYIILHSMFENDFIITEPSYGKKISEGYKGGFVLDPAIGKYDNIVLLFDFSSLYPSIVREYNLCFTDLSNLGSNKKILPHIFEQLTQERNDIRNKIRQTNDTGLVKKMDTEQNAIKLISNSIIGCHALPSFRFYCISLAKEITQKGRELLVKSKDNIENAKSVVIYGDTDSLMVKTSISNDDDMGQILELSEKIKKKVNIGFKCISLNLDKIFTHLLLIKKKQYVGYYKVTDCKGGFKKEPKLEMKGVDGIKKDICQVVKNSLLKTVHSILNGKSAKKLKEDIDKSIEDIRKHKVSRDFICTRTVKNFRRSFKKITQPQEVVAVYSVINGSLSLEQSSKASLKYVICKGRNVQYFDIINKMAYAVKGMTNDIMNNICIVEGSTANYTLAWGDFVGTKGEINTEWYITHQLKPSLSRLIVALKDVELDDTLEILQANTKKVTTLEKINELAIKCTKCQKETEVKGVYHELFMISPLYSIKCEHCKFTIDETIEGDILYYIKSHCFGAEGKPRIKNINYIRSLFDIGTFVIKKQASDNSDSIWIAIPKQTEKMLTSSYRKMQEKVQCTLSELLFHNK